MATLCDPSLERTIVCELVRVVRFWPPKYNSDGVVLEALWALNKVFERAVPADAADEGDAADAADELMRRPLTCGKHEPSLKQAAIQRRHEQDPLLDNVAFCIKPGLGHGVYLR